MFCTQCANQLSNNDRFCAQCGCSANAGTHKNTNVNNHSETTGKKKTPQPSTRPSPTRTAAPKREGKVSVQDTLQDPAAQAFVEPLRDMCNLIADRITDYLPLDYFAQFLSITDVVAEVGQGFESGEIEQTDCLNVYSSVLEGADFTDSMASYRHKLNSFPEVMAQQYNFLLETLVNNNIDETIMQYALDDKRLKIEADTLQTTLAKPAADAAAALKSVVASYPVLVQQINKANADFGHLVDSQETMDNSDFWSYAQGLAAFAINPAMGAMSLMRTHSRVSDKNHRVQDRVGDEVAAAGESLESYLGILFHTFEQLHQTAQIQCTQLSEALLELYAKPFLLARHVGSIDDWETLGEAASAIVGEGIYAGLIEDDDETFEEIIERSRELMQSMMEEAESS